MHTRRFKDISKGDVTMAGGKGASLGEMTKAEIPVPAGFVVLASAFERFLEGTDLNVEIDAILHTVKHTEMHTVEGAAEKIQACILSGTMLKDIASEILREFKKLKTSYVAVRSSATAEDSASAAWAGQLDSFLNTSEKDLLKNVQRCWASLFTPRAIFYRFEKGLHNQKIGVAVVVQKMVESEVSGIAFSVHPVTEDRNQLIIEAGFGLGEAIVSGQVTPDSYVVEKQPRRILDKNISEQRRGLFRLSSSSPQLRGGAESLRQRGGVGEPNEWKDIPRAKGEKQKLSDKQILELSELILRIENHYGFPCDIEWAVEKGKFSILQSRPITTLKQKVKEVPLSRDILGLKWVPQWTTKYSLFSAQLFAEEYTSLLYRFLGYGFNHILMKSEDGLVSIYYVEDEVKNFRRYFATRSLNENDFSSHVINTLESVWHNLQKYFLHPEWMLDTKKLHKFLELHRMFLPHYLVVVRTADGLQEVKGNKKQKERLFESYFRARKEVEDSFAILEQYLGEVFTKIAKEEGVSPITLSVLSPDEFIAYVEKKVLPDSQELSERLTYAVVLSSTKRGSELVLGDKARTLIKHISRIDSSVLELRGQTVFGGKRKGKVRVIFDLLEEQELEKGDILVATMTRPEWLPLLKRAGAFITDGGGLLCHAAIVSRELKKPCIIGTKIATKVLKDGDMVEVDAKRGIITVLEKAGSRQDVSIKRGSDKGGEAQH